MRDRVDVFSDMNRERLRSGRLEVLQSTILEVLLDIRHELVELNKK